MKPNEIIDIATKGESKVVFQITGEDLMNLLRYIAKDSNKGENILHTAEREHMYAVLCTTVRELYDAGKISVRTLRGLIDHNITTLGALCQTTPKELTKFAISVISPARRRKTCYKRTDSSLAWT